MRKGKVPYQLWLTPEEHKFFKTNSAACGINMKNAFMDGAKMLFKSHNEKNIELMDKRIEYEIK